jgi:5'-nucleotidase
MVKPLILVTNDDGIVAPGIRALIAVMKEIGDVVVVAPDSPQSAMGHAITINNTLKLERVHIDNEIGQEYSCSGTPVDCVKIAVNEVLKRKPDLCVSGINHGSNSSINVIYSGTMSAAVEAGIEDIPAIGFSLLDYSWDADFEPIKKHIKQICRQAKAMWQEEFDKRTNPQGKEYYWLTGKFVNQDKGTDTDEWALANGYISIVPVQFDLTAHHAIQSLNAWDL